MCQSDEEQEHQPQSEPLINSLLHSYCVGKHGRHSSHLSEYLWAMNVIMDMFGVA